MLFTITCVEVQVDGLAMGESLAVIRANLWLKEYEFALRQETPVGTEIQQVIDKNGLCPCCSRFVPMLFIYALDTACLVILKILILNVPMKVL